MSNITVKDRFVQAGVALQKSALSWPDAKNWYESTCNYCVSLPDCAAMECGNCQVRAAMLGNAKMMERRIPEQDYEWLQREKELQ